MAARRSTSSSAGASADALTADKPIVILHGKEPFVIDERTNELIRALDEKHGEIERFSFDGANAELSEVLDELRSYGLMQQHKLVIVNQADEFLKVRKDEQEADDEEESAGPAVNKRAAMERYAEAPVDHATLLLRATTWHKGKLDKIVKKTGAVVKCDELGTTAAAQWCVKRTKEAHGCTLERNAATAIVERRGVGLIGLDNELARLAAMIPPGGTITLDTVRDVVGRSREENAWVIQEALLRGGARGGLEKMNELYDTSKEPSGLAIMLSWSLVDLARKLHAASRLIRQGMNPGLINKHLKLWGHGANLVHSAARSGSPTRFAQLLREAILTDRRIKSGHHPRRTLEGLIVLLADSVR